MQDTSFLFLQCCDRLLALPLPAPDAIETLQLPFISRRPLDLRLRHLKPGDNRRVVRLRVKDLGSEDDGLIMQEFVMHLRALKIGKHGS